MTAAPAVMNWMHVLADETRARLLRLLERSELTVAELCAILQAPQSTVSRHLKVLADDGWLAGRRDGTRRLYHVPSGRWEAGRRKLWTLVREQTSSEATSQQDDLRYEQILAERQSRGQQFISSAAGQWDKLRTEMFGRYLDQWILAATLDERASVADLGCGTGGLSQVMAPFVRQVIAVDQSAAMLRAARSRLAGLDQVQFHQADLADLPLEDGCVDLATLVLVLPFAVRPADVIREATRILRPAGQLVVVDMQAHDRLEYQQQMGHVWMGFEREQLYDWMDQADCELSRWVMLPPDAQAKGPSLFAATARRPATSR